MEKYMEQYERWLASDKLSEAEKEELRAIREDKKEIEFRFSSYLSF